MKLDFNMKGSWAGTQADAKAKWGKDGWDEVDVPVSKAELLSFLNEYKCLDFEATRYWSEQQVDDALEDEIQTMAASQVDNWDSYRRRTSWEAPINKYDIHDIAASASLKDLTQAMAVYLNRIDEELS